MPPLSNILGDIASQPADSPMGLPGSLYTSEDYFHDEVEAILRHGWHCLCLLYTSPSPRDRTRSRMPSSA